MNGIHTQSSYISGTLDRNPREGDMLPSYTVHECQNGVLVKSQSMENGDAMISIGNRTAFFTKKQLKKFIKELSFLEL